MSALQDITYYSKLDNSMQKAFFCPAEGDAPRPLAVCLHTWSYGYNQLYEHFLTRCRKRNWHFIFPHFRGPNNTPEGCGSDLVVSDLECAVEFVRKNYPLDEGRIYLVGGSGGGHAALLMAGRRPEIWTAVSAWCPVTDIAAWCREARAAKENPDDLGYDSHIVKACSGDPAKDPRAMEEAKHRSPLTWLPAVKGKGIIEIGVGIHDGHPGVPVSHGFLAYNALAAEKDRLSPEDIEYMRKNEKVPPHLLSPVEDPSYGKVQILFRRVSERVRLTIFEGGHSILPGPAFGFLEQQERNKAPFWGCGKAEELTTEETLSK